MEGIWIGFWYIHDCRAGAGNNLGNILGNALKNNMRACLSIVNRDTPKPSFIYTNTYIYIYIYIGLYQVPRDM